MAFWNRKKEPASQDPEVTPVPAVPPEERQPQASPPAAAESAPAEPAQEQEEEKKKRRGKPQDDARRTRNCQVKLRLTEEESAELKSAAAAAGMSLADYVMAGVHQSRVIRIPGAAQIRTELIREGRNLNQALYLAFTARKEGRPADLQSIKTVMAKVEDNLDRLTELILKWDADITEEVTEKEEKQNADSEMQCQ